MLADHAALNLGNIWAAVSHASRTDAALLGVLVVGVVIGACMALYIGAGLAYQYWNEEVAKRLRRRMRMRRRRSALHQRVERPEVPATLRDSPRRHSYAGLSAAAWTIVLGCSVVAVASALTVEYFSGYQHTAVKRATDRELAQAPTRLRIDYELRQR